MIRFVQLSVLTAFPVLQFSPHTPYPPHPTLGATLSHFGFCSSVAGFLINNADVDVWHQCRPVHVVGRNKRCDGIDSRTFDSIYHHFLSTTYQLHALPHTSLTPRLRLHTTHGTPHLKQWQRYADLLAYFPASIFILAAAASMAWRIVAASNKTCAFRGR